MRILKSQSILRLVNSYMIDSPQPANISYLWNFGSLLGTCLIIQILTGVFLAMHYTPHVDFAFNSVEHIMRDVNAGYILRYTHANVASFFFIFVYAHIARGLFYSSYKAPRTLVWTIGVIILIVMMAILILWPNCKYDTISILPLIGRDLGSPICLRRSMVTQNRGAGASHTGNMLPINRSRTKALIRIGPHNKQVLDIIICGMLGDFWADKIPGKQLDSIRFNIEQSISNTAYIHYLTLLFYNLGYCARPVPTLVEKHSFPVLCIHAVPSERYANISKEGCAGLTSPCFAACLRHGTEGSFPSEGTPCLDGGMKIQKAENRFNYRLTLFTFTSFGWIYDSFYKATSVAKQGEGAGKKEINQKRVPTWISDYLTPAGLAHWIMQDGSHPSGQKGQGVSIATNSFTYDECKFLANTLTNKYNLKTSVVKTGTPNQWRISIWKQSMPLLSSLVKPYFIPEMQYKLSALSST